MHALAEEPDDACGGSGASKSKSALWEVHAANVAERRSHQQQGIGLAAKVRKGSQKGRSKGCEKKRRLPLFSHVLLRFFCDFFVRFCGQSSPALSSA
jgi:hypothetical protein